MIAIAVATGVLGVGQTWLSNVVGQRVMHDLRAQVYRHLQRLSLAFFTRTRTGEIQSRIANDIGGVQTVVTTTATSIVSNVTTVVATRRRDVPARLAAGALLARRCCRSSCCSPAASATSGRQITTVKQGAMADISSLVQESLSVSGILLGKTMGRGAELADRFEGESARLADLEVRSRMAGRWMMAAIQTSFAVMPALVYLFAGLAAERGLDRHRRRLHHAADAAVLSRSSRCSASASTSRPRPRCSSASSSTSTCRSTSSRARATLRDVARRGRASTTSGSATATSDWTLRGIDLDGPGRARGPRSSARPARARRRSATSPRGSTTPSAAPCASTAPTCAS